MRVIALAAVFLALGGAAAPAFDPAEFNRAIEAADYKRAASIVDALIADRTPVDGKPRPDPLINALTGRVLLLARQPGPATIYFAHVDWSGVPSSLRAASLLAYAKSLELQGRRPEALEVYRKAAAETGPADAAHSAALLGVARQLLVTNPAEAAQLVAPMASTANTRTRWQVLQIMAIAASLSGDAAAGSSLASRAWADASNADASDLAPMKVAVTRAALAAQRGNTSEELAMLIAANSLGIGKTDALSAQLPVCGEDGVRPDDFVIFGIVVGPYNTNSLIPVAASRKEVVQAFYDRLDGWDLINRASEESAQGTIVTLACRSIVSSNYAASAAFSDPLLEWFVQKGIYPAELRFDVSDEAVNRISTRIDDLVARFGRDSPLLLEPEFQLANFLWLRATQGADIPVGRVLEHRRNLVNGLRREGAPVWIADFMDLQSHQVIGGSGDVSASALMNLAQRQLDSLPWPLARDLLRGSLANLSGDPPTTMEQMVVELDSRMPSTLPLRERQAWLLNVARAKRYLGQTSEIRKLAERGSFHRRLCDTAEQPPKILKNDFNYDDYPPAMMAAEQQGYAEFELEISATGQVKTPRMIVSLPSGMFDEPTRDGFGKLQYSAANDGRGNFDCKGFTQGVVWKLQSPSFEYSPLIPSQTGNHT